MNAFKFLGKLVYLHKCVVPARIFVNRLLELFRKNFSKQKLYLTNEFFRDIDWFQAFLPHFNGTTKFNKSRVEAEESLCLDTCLTGIRAIWGNRVYSAPINSHFSLVLKGLFDIKTLNLIFFSCDILSDPLLFRSIFLVSFYGFLRMSEVAPHSSSNFDPSKQFLRKGRIFGPQGAHLIMKWSKTLQSLPLTDDSPLFASGTDPYKQIIDTAIRDAVRTVLLHRRLPTRSYGFHTFHRSGATFAFDLNVQIQNIMYHGTLHSSAVWSYIQQSSYSSSIVPLIFAQYIPSFF